MYKHLVTFSTMEHHLERKPFKPNALILQVYLFTAVYKTGAGTRGRGHWDACLRTCDLGRETRDLGTSSMGRGDVWDGDAEYVNEYCKSLR